MDPLHTKDLIWAIGSCCALHRIPFDAGLLLSQHAPPYGAVTLITAARAIGFLAQQQPLKLKDLSTTTGTVVLLLAGGDDGPAIGLVLSATQETITWYAAGSNEPVTQALADFAARYTGEAVVLRKRPEAANDADAPAAARFGFRWFVPELLKHRKVWRDVLGASLVLQLLALGLPLFTQAIIDKVVVHQTESTLIALSIGMGIFLVFTAIMSWVRQYLVLHTGNRVDAVLAATVFDHLFKLPPRYFQHRPTGVIAARLQGVETIREFVSS
ncbi:MAG: peptidase domain-containing ABC transporter, partial [Ramlibacter sp.]|nr:peptidase domain-containing ABC transporter [Ramlibacter sp.]